MPTQQEKIGAYIATLRKAKQMTQADLGERCQVSCQAISKWERGECLPDTGILLMLAEILGTTVDSLLRGGEVTLLFSGKISAENILGGIQSLMEVPGRIGKDNTIYQGIAEGLRQKMNLDWDEDFKGKEERWVAELLTAEVIAQELKHGKYVDLAEVNRLFTIPKWKETVARYANAYGIK